MPHFILSKPETTIFVVSFLLLLSLQSIVLLLSGLGIFAFFVLKRKELYFIWSILAPRITGSMPILEYLLELSREEGPGDNELNDLFRLDIPFLKPMFFVFKPSYIKRVLSLEADNFPTRGSDVLAKLAVNSKRNILLNEGPPSPHWMKFRTITSPINKDRSGDGSLLSQIFDVAWNATQERVYHFNSKKGQTFDLFYELYHVMIPAHNRALFGDDVVSKFAYRNFTEEMYDVITEAGTQLKCPATTPKKERKLRREADRISETVLHMAKSSSSPFMKPLLEAFERGDLTEHELHSNLMVFEYAHAPLHVTFWVLYLLSLHPEDEKKVVHEIATVLSQGPIAHSRLGEFKHLAKVIAETLRLYPGVGLMQARFPKTNTMFGKHFVPENSHVFVCPFVLQRNSKYWPNPDDFDPSREDLDVNDISEKIMQMPFGFGPRQCQGQYYAQDFIKVTVISLLQHYRFSVAPNQKAAIPTEVGFLRPARPVYFNIQERVMPAVQCMSSESMIPSSPSMRVPPSPSQRVPQQPLSTVVSPPSPSLRIPLSPSPRSLTPPMPAPPSPTLRAPSPSPSPSRTPPSPTQRTPPSPGRALLSTPPSPLQLSPPSSPILRTPSPVHSSPSTPRAHPSLSASLPIPPPTSSLSLGRAPSSPASPVLRRRSRQGVGLLAGKKMSLVAARRCSTPQLMGVVEKMTDMLVAFGSQSGNASGFASRLVSMAELRGLTVKLLPLSKVEPFSLSQYKLVIVVTSTYGEGAAPDNAEAFSNWLEKAQIPSLWSGVEYAVLSLGSSLHSNPFKFGSFISHKFEQLGANRVMPDGILDEVAYSQQEIFAVWSSRLFEIIREKGIGNAMPKVGGEFDFVPRGTLRFRDQLLPSEKRVVPSDAVVTSVISNEQANSEPNNPIYSMELQFHGEKPNFEAGDSISVIPANKEEDVRTVVSILGYQGDQVFECAPTSSCASLSCSLGEGLCTLELALRHFFDISSPPSVRMLQFLAACSKETHDQKILCSYSVNYEAFLQLNLSMLDVLEKFSSIQIIKGNKTKDEDSLAAFLSLLEPMKPRHYSVASSPAVNSTSLRIIYKVVNYVCTSGQTKQGLCTNWLQSKQLGDEVVLTVNKSKFKLPTNNSEIPIIMIGVGSGISPYVSFMEQRAYIKSQGKNIGQGVLIHGCRSAEDFVYKDKIDLALSYGAISSLWPAYSRTTEPMHIQDIIEKEGKTIWKLLNKKGGILYVCGDTNVGVTVREALLRVAMTRNSWGAFKANCWLQKLVSARRIRHDEWGTGTQPET